MVLMGVRYCTLRLKLVFIFNYLLTNWIVCFIYCKPLWAWMNEQMNERTVPIWLLKCDSSWLMPGQALNQTVFSWFVPTLVKSLQIAGLWWSCRGFKGSNVHRWFAIAGMWTSSTVTIPSTKKTSWHSLTIQDIILYILKIKYCFLLASCLQQDLGEGVL